jgi:hypothetical protein
MAPGLFLRKEALLLAIICKNDKIKKLRNILSG